MTETRLTIRMQWLTRDQEAVFHAPQRYVVVRAGRRWGKTKGGMMRVIEAAFQEKQPILWVDVTQGNIEQYFNEHMLPLLPTASYRWNKQQKVLTFINGSVVKFGSAERPENLEGFGYKKIFLNEAGLILRGEAGERLWHNTLRAMTVEHQAQVYFIGTPKGTGLYRDFSEKARSGEPDWMEFHRTTYQNPIILDAEIDKLMADMPPKVFRQEILAEFLDDDDGDPVIAYADAKDAYHRLLAQDRGYKVIWGLDVGQFGDDESALLKRRFNVLLEPVKTWRDKDSSQLTDILKAEYESTPLDHRPHEIMVDEIGYGAGVYDQARRMGLPVRGVNVSRRPSDPKKFFQLRDELWFKASAWIKTGSIAADNALRHELCKPLYDIEFLQKKGLFKVEAKEAMKRRLRAAGASPNKADALILTMACGIEKISDAAKQASWRGTTKREGTWMSA